MSLQDWLSNGLLNRHQTGKQEIGDLLAAADRDIRDAETPGLGADWRLSIAHNSALMSATAALAAAGFRAVHEAYHYRVLQSLVYTIGASKPFVKRLDVLRKKRNITGYERPGVVSEVEADEMVRLARELRVRVDKWLRENYPGLL